MEIIGNIILSVLTGIVAGVVSGLYTAIIGAKFASFEESRREILKVLRSIHYDEKYIQGHEESELNRIWLASSEFLSMKQIEAGKLIRYHYGILLNDIDGKRAENTISEQILSDFQKEVSELKLNKIELLKIW